MTVNSRVFGSANRSMLSNFQWSKQRCYDNQTWKTICENSTYFSSVQGRENFCT